MKIDICMAKFQLFPSAFSVDMVLTRMRVTTIEALVGVTLNSVATYIQGLFQQ